MTEHELRLLVREAIARQKVGGTDVREPLSVTMNADPFSHRQFEVPSGTDACIIEPSVPCTHCGYCRSYGH
jgi:hypothetical protein